MFRIKIHYQTGNSMDTYDETSYIEHSWTNLDVAKENLQRIKAHYEYYRLKNAYDAYHIQKEIKANEEKCKKEPWYCKNGAEYRLMLKTDYGEEFSYTTGQWCGYFERLHSAEIVNEAEDMRIDFA